MIFFESVTLTNPLAVDQLWNRELNCFTDSHTTQEFHVQGNDQDDAGNWATCVHVTAFQMAQEGAD